MSMLNKIICLVTGQKRINRWWKRRCKALSYKSGVRALFLKYSYFRASKKLSGGGYIPLSAKIKDCPSFPHGLSGIFVSSGAVIGSGCTIFQQVTIGSNTLKDSKGYGAPQIGNNVYIGAGAKIIGDVHIGDNSRIGANAVVTHNVPDNSTVVLGEMRVFTKSRSMSNNYEAFQKMH